MPSPSEPRRGSRDAAPPAAAFRRGTRSSELPGAAARASRRTESLLHRAASRAAARGWRRRRPRLRRPVADVAVPGTEPNEAPRCQIPRLREDPQDRVSYHVPEDERAGDREVERPHGKHAPNVDYGAGIEQCPTREDAERRDEEA